MIAADRLALGTCAFGRAIDAEGAPLDGGPALDGRRVTLEPVAPRPNERGPILEPLWTGVRAIDALLTIGRGARIGIFGAPGVGKTALLESLVQGCAADAVVVALAGERGREAQSWIARCDARTTIVCATSDRPARERIAAAHVAVAHATALRERGLAVLLVLDSLARVAAALRETAVAAGESTGRGGYPPSVFAELARIVEVAGVAGDGSVTLAATVLSDGDDRDPVSESARSLLDGHIALSLTLAQAGRFPAVNVLSSTSRTMEIVAARTHVDCAAALRGMLALLDRVKDVRSLGIEIADRSARAAIALEPRLDAFLRQGREHADSTATLSTLAQLAALAEQARGDN